MKAPEGTRKNHTNSGSGGTHGLGADHHITRIADPEDISGGGNPGTDERLKRVVKNSGGASTHGLAAKHHTTRIHNAHPVETEIMDKGK